jgi:hypothetical protein
MREIYTGTPGDLEKQKMNTFLQEVTEATEKEAAGGLCFLRYLCYLLSKLPPSFAALGACVSRLGESAA